MVYPLHTRLSHLNDGTNILVYTDKKTSSYKNMIPLLRGTFSSNSLQQKEEEEEESKGNRKKKRKSNKRTRTSGVKCWIDHTRLK